MEYWGNYCGIFKYGIQIGTFQGWMFAEVLQVISDANTSGMNICQIKAWQGLCQMYLLKEDPGDGEVEFRFVAKSCFYQATGRMKTAKPYQFGLWIKEKVELEGRGMPEAKYPPRRKRKL